MSKSKKYRRINKWYRTKLKTGVLSRRPNYFLYCCHRVKLYDIIKMYTRQCVKQVIGYIAGNTTLDTFLRKIEGIED